jgi:putative chitinase
MDRAFVWAPVLAEAMELFAISTETRAADFIAQLGHESAGLLWTAELWGPTPAQVTYERDFDAPWTPDLRRTDRNFKAWNLGNAFKGDGRKFAGHGPIQVTGRKNHARARDNLRVLLGTVVPDFEADPEQLRLPRWGALAAGEFWKRNDLNIYADRLDFVGQTERINGGQNGLADRLDRRVQARLTFGLPV